MRICRITPEFPPSRGGLSQGICDLTKAQRRRGHDVTVLTKDCGKTDCTDDVQGLEVVRLTAGRNFAFSYRAAKWVLANQESHHFDIIHAHGVSGVCISLARRLRPGTIPPVIAMSHTLRKRQYAQYWRYDLYGPVENVLGKGLAQHRKIARREWRMRLNRELLFERWAYRFADAIAPVARHIAEGIHREYGIESERIVPVLNGVDLPPAVNGVPGDLKKELLRSAEGKMLLYVGRIELSKGCQDLVMALTAVIRQDRHRVKLVMVGWGGGGRDNRGVDRGDGASGARRRRTVRSARTAR